jgi:hypothetical protein
MLVSITLNTYAYKQQTQWLLVRKLTVPTDSRRWLAKLVPTFGIERCCVVSTTAPHGS